MYKFAYKLKITERVTAKCQRHPRYNPEREGRGGIKGGCKDCEELSDLHDARLRLDASVKEFVRRAGPWARVRERRTRKKRTPPAEQEQTPEVQP